MITQRSAVLNKDVLTQASCLFVLRILHKIDKDAVETWVMSVAGQEEGFDLNQWYDELREMKNGEVYVWHPEDPKKGDVPGTGDSTRHPAILPRS